MSLSEADFESWAEAYIACNLDPTHLRDGHPLFWSIERFMTPELPEQAEECWKCILLVLSKRPPDEVLGVLAAGPLEDLIDDHGPRFIDRIETAAWQDPAFRSLLNGVWESSTPDIWARVERAMNRDGAV